jgi:hypothetical protein
MRYIICLALFSLFFFTDCNKRSRCPAYQEVGALGIPDDNYEPTNYIIVQRNKKTGLVKKVGKVKKVRYTSREEKSKLLRKEKKYIKDTEIFPDVKNSKKAKKKKKNKNEEEPEKEENVTPTDSL